MPLKHQRRRADFVFQLTEDDRPAADFEFCATKPAMVISAATPVQEVVEAGRRIARATGLDACGIEYLVDERDGAPFVYDINVLSNFVTDASRIVGFDPFERFAEYIDRRLQTAAADPQLQAVGGTR